MGAGAATATSARHNREAHADATGKTRARTFATTVVLVLALGSAAGCGSPARVGTLDGDPDLARIFVTIPPGFSKPVNEELERLRATCMAIDANVGTQLPDIGPVGEDVTHLALIDGQCLWNTPAGPSSRPPGAPELVVGIVAAPDGGITLDRTTMVLKGERPIAGVGDRAVFDRETRTLYVLENGRLWYLQLVGSAPGAAAQNILAVLARSLLETREAG